MDNNITLVVFGLNKSENIKRVVMGEKLGTIVRGENR
jgi:uridylate kinase